jgi:hypothetical protein
MIPKKIIDNSDKDIVEVRLYDVPLPIIKTEKWVVFGGLVLI